MYSSDTFIIMLIYLKYNILILMGINRLKIKLITKIELIPNTD